MTESRTPAAYANAHTPEAYAKTHIRIARAFEGPRHDRLAKIWDCIAEYAQDDVRLIVEPNLNPRLSHAEIFERMYAKDVKEPNRYLLLTEYDWLPDLGGDWLPTHVFDQEEIAVLATQYYTRNPTSMHLRKHPGLPGGWFLLIDKTRAPHIRTFHGTPDPGNQLAHEANTLVLPGEDCYPLHYGVEYPTGTHLFWSRHYHDGDDNDVVAGVRLGEMRALHDQAVTLWLRFQPAEFLRLVLSRHPEILDA